MRTDRRGFLGAIAAALVTSALPLPVRAAAARIAPPTHLLPIASVDVTAGTTYSYTAALQVQRGRVALAMTFVDAAGKVLARSIGPLNGGRIVATAPAGTTACHVQVAAWGEDDRALIGAPCLTIGEPHDPYDPFTWKENYPGADPSDRCDHLKPNATSRCNLKGYYHAGQDHPFMPHVHDALCGPGRQCEGE